MPSSLKRRLTDGYISLICRVAPHCHDMTRLISLEQEEKLPLFQRLRMRLHYGICIWCERYRDHLEALRAASREFPEKAGEIPGGEMSAESKARIKRALRKSE